MKTFLAFAVGVVVGVIIHIWYDRSEARITGITPEQRSQPPAADADRNPGKATDPSSMKDELARTGKIIREKAIQAGETIGDAAVDAGISTKIKAKLVQDAGLSAFRIDVDTNDRMVTLSGTVSSLEEIDRAMNLALETDGVRRVVSTLQIKGERHN
jgi:hypothetical protein